MPEELAEAVRSLVVRLVGRHLYMSNPHSMTIQSRRCELRVHSAREQEARARRRQMEEEAERRRRSDEAGALAPELAAQRLRERRTRERQQRESDIDLLIAQQPSSIRAMNIARMLSPRFEERVTFAPSVPRRSRADERVTELLEGGPIVGSFYK